MFNKTPISKNKLEENKKIKRKKEKKTKKFSEFIREEEDD